MLFFEEEISLNERCLDIFRLTHLFSDGTSLFNSPGYGISWSQIQKAKQSSLLTMEAEASQVLTVLPEFPRPRLHNTWTFWRLWLCAPAYHQVPVTEVKWSSHTAGETTLQRISFKDSADPFPRCGIFPQQYQASSSLPNVSSFLWFWYISHTIISTFIMGTTQWFSVYSQGYTNITMT